MQTSLTNLRRRNLSWNTHSSEYPALFLPPRTSSTLVRPSKYLVLITSYQISNFLQSTKQVSSLHLSPLDSARGEKVARREACSIVVRQHYSRSRYARGVEPSFKRPPSIRRQHRYDYVSNGREKHDSTRDFSGCEPVLSLPRRWSRGCSTPQWRGFHVKSM